MNPVPNGPISLVLIDNNRVLREGLSELIREQANLSVLTVLTDGGEAVQKVRDARPQVILLAVESEDSDRLRLVVALRQEVPDAKIVIMGVHAFHEDIVDFVRAGASGFIMNDAPFEDFVATIRSVAEGVYVLPRQLTAALFRQIHRHMGQREHARTPGVVRLTNRERQVIDLICEGHSNKEIAASLDIALHTVKSHVHNVLEKLALHSRLEIATFIRRDSRPAPSSDA